MVSSRVNGVIAPLIQGVSQQPAQFRLEGQSQEQINFFSDPINGLHRRPPTTYISTLISSGEYKVTSLVLNPYSVYIVLYNSSQFRMFDLNGVEQTVSLPDGLSYIGNDFIKFESFSGIAYVLNTSKTVQKLLDLPSAILNGGIFYLLGGQFVRSYHVDVSWRRTVGGVLQTASLIYNTPNSSNNGDLFRVQTWNIATELVNSALLDANFTLDFEIIRAVDVVYIYPKAGRTVLDFYFSVISDGDANINLQGISRQVTDLGKIPKFAPNGYVVEVTESNSTEADNYWLQFYVENESIGTGFGKEGVWLETTSPYEPYKLDPSTMPMKLIQTGATTFSLQQEYWEERGAGDNKSNPFPSFTGFTIEDLSSFQGRLVAISNNNVIKSRTNKPESWFSNSATVVADTDPIDIYNSINSYYFKYLVPYNRDLLVFADKGQFIIAGRNALTPQNCSLVLASTWESNLTTKPELSGNSIFYNTKAGSYSVVSEMFADGTQDNLNSVNITQNIPEYIQGTVLQFINPSGFNKLFVRTDTALNEVYLHEYLWIGDKKAQSAWSKLIFPSPVIEMCNLDNRVYFVLQNGSSLDLLFMQLDNTDTPALNFRISLDYIIVRTNVNKTFTIPYSIIGSSDDYVCTQSTGTPNIGLEAEIESIVGNTVTLKQSMNNGSIRFGRKYKSEYKLTKPYVKDQNNQKLDGNLTIQNFIINYQDTGSITFTSASTLGTVVTNYSNTLLGNSSNLLGYTNVNTGSVSVPIFRNTANTDFSLHTDKHTPIQIQSIEWNGMFIQRRRRV